MSKLFLFFIYRAGRAGMNLMNVYVAVAGKNFADYHHFWLFLRVAGKKSTDYHH